MHPKVISKQESFLVDEIKMARKEIVGITIKIFSAENKIREGNMIVNGRKKKTWSSRIGELKIKFNRQYHKLITLENQTRLPYSTHRDLLFIARQEVQKPVFNGGNPPESLELIVLRENIASAIIKSNRLERSIEKQSKIHLTKGLAPLELQKKLATTYGKLKVQLDIIDEDSDSFTQIVGTLSTREFDKFSYVVKEDERNEAIDNSSALSEIKFKKRYKDDLNTIKEAMMIEMKQSFASASGIVMTDILNSLNNNKDQNSDLALTLMEEFNVRMGRVVDKINMYQS